MPLSLSTCFTLRHTASPMPAASPGVITLHPVSRARTTERNIFGGFSAQRRQVLVAAKAGGIGKGVSEGATIHMRVRTPHEQLVVLRIVVVIINDNDGVGDVVEFMVGYVVEFM
jgi:hypothetical protein